MSTENESLTVLIAEDSTKMRAQLIGQLEAMGVTPIVAKSGFEALALAHNTKPELILLDGLLPEMHGFEISRAIRKMDPNYRPRIAIMTAIYKGVQYQNEARLKYGIDDYLIKPLSDAVLSDLLERARRGSPTAPSR